MSPGGDPLCEAVWGLEAFGGAGEATHLTSPVPSGKVRGCELTVCVRHRDGLKPLSGVAAGRLLAGTIGILFSLLERGPWVQKFSNVF